MDIVERLRSLVDPMQMPQFALAAADEIERLRSEMQGMNVRLGLEIGRKNDEIENLRQQLATVMKDRGELVAICKSVVDSGISFVDIKAMCDVIARVGDSNTARPPTPIGWSDTDWIKHLQEQHPLAGLHINQGSMDAAADAYEAEYNAAQLTRREIKHE